MTLPLGVALLTAAASGSMAWALRFWVRNVAATTSVWLRSDVVVVLAAVGGFGAAALATSYAELPAFALLALACALLVVVDLAALRLPDIIVGPMYLVLFAALLTAAAVGNEWGRLGRSAVAAAVLLVGYFVLAFISPASLGLGDVKLAGLLGAFLGWLGWSHVLVGTLAAFLLSGLVALVLVIAFRARRRTDFAFGPWMVVGAVVGAALGPPLLVAHG